MLEAVVDYLKLLSAKILGLRPSPTFKVADAAKKLKDAKQTVYDFSVGAPAEATPEYIRNSLDTMLAHDPTWEAASKYPPVSGLPALKKAIVEKLKDENGLNYTPNDVLISNGGKQAIASAFAVTINPGDEVLLPEPSWVSYADMVKWHGGVPVGMITNDEFKITAESLEHYLQDHDNVKWLVLNSPSNPTGATYSKEELQDIARVVLKANEWRVKTKKPPLMVLSDDIYEHMVYDDQYMNKPGDKSAVANNIIMAEPKMKPYTVIVNGVAKAFGMTGWRIGYAAGPEKIISAMADYQGLETSGISVIGQLAALAALSRDNKKAREKHFKEQRETYTKRRDLVDSLINDGSTSMKFTPQPGAFYAMIDCTDLAQKAGGTHKLADRMIGEKGVALVPGNDFFVDPDKQDRKYLRLSFATDDKTIREGIAKMKELEKEIMPDGPPRGKPRA